jgi:Dolichyl-phosphate-mannose-protein mannosyltransferase
MLRTSETVMLPRIAGTSGASSADYEPPAAPADQPVAKRSERWLPWLPLILIMVVQSVLALRLNNSAFIDEGTYLYAGHREIATLLHGTPNPDNYSLYFSGAPFLYPIMGALADAVGGLAGARALSLVFMLGATAFLYASTNRLFGRLPAIFATALFALSGPALFMSHLATYDAPAVMMLAFAMWLATRTMTGRAVLLDIAIVCAGAVALKYASMVYVLPIVGLTALVAVPRSGWRFAITRGVLLGLLTAMIGGSVLLLSGSGVLQGVSSTTTARADDSYPVMTVVDRSAVYTGIVLGIAVLGTILYAFRPGDRPLSGWLNRALLGVVLTGADLIAPVGDIRLHTVTSLEKHAGYGLMFAAPMAGLLLARLAGRSKILIALPIVLTAAIATSGAIEARDFFNEWPNTTALVQALRPLVTNHSQIILAEEDMAPRYYMAGQVRQTQWQDTYYLQTLDPTTGTMVTGEQAYAITIAQRRYAYIVFNFNTTWGLDNQLVPIIASSGYQLLTKVPYRTRFGSGSFSIYQRIEVKQ